MVSFNEIQGFQGTLSATVCYCIKADPTVSLICGMVLFLWIMFYNKARMTGKAVFISSLPQKYTFNLTFKK
jgi:hypothetical protein